MFAGNDQMAIGLMSALRRRDLLVPDDVSIAALEEGTDESADTPLPTHLVVRESTRELLRG